MLCMLKHTLFSCVYAKDTFSIHKITAALANLCISVHYDRLNLMLPSASKSQKITFILMKCTKTVATRAAPFGPEGQICTKSFLSGEASPQTPLGELIALPRSPSWFRGWDSPGKGKKEGREREGRGRWDWDPSTREGKGGEGNGGKDGGGRVVKGGGRKGRGGIERK